MRAWHAMTALLALGAAAAVAQGAAQQQPPAHAPAAVVAAAGIDPEARALLNKMAAAYRALSSYSAEIAVQAEGPAHGPGMRATIAVRRPDRAAIEVAGPAGVTRVVSDSARVFLLAPGAASATRENLAGGAVEGALRKAGLLDTRVGHLLIGQDPLQIGDGTLQSLRLGGTGLRAGMPVDKVVAARSTPRGEQTITFAIARKDHLLRQVVVSYHVRTDTFSESEIELNVQADADLPDAAFAIRRPAAAQAQPGVAAGQQPGAAGPFFSGPLQDPAAPGPAFGAVAAPAPPLSPPVRYDFGQVSLIDTPAIEHEFRWKNSGTAPVKIQRLRSSCGCTSAVVAGPAGSAPGDLLPTLAPGQEISVKVTVDLTPLRPGLIHKSVAVYAEDPRQPIALFEVTGTLRPSVTFSPPVINLGGVEAGQEHTVAVTVTLDRRLLAAGPLPPLVCSNSAVQIRPEPAPPEAPGADPAVRAFTVVLGADAPIGPISGMVSFAVPIARAISPSARTAARGAAAALRTAYLAVFGQVTGAISAMPQGVAFGVAPTGEQVTREVTLTGKDAAVFEKLAATTESRSISCRLVPPADGAAPAVSRTLEVTLSADAPAGPLRAEIVVKLANGQRLLLPVNGYLRAVVRQ